MISRDNKTIPRNKTFTCESLPAVHLAHSKRPNNLSICPKWARKRPIESNC
ncbi:hypothetical protein KP13_32090 (plasmid) [Klebsiella pneumoniae subsp. pneumoniae Kp13]|nr:hypothetical protein KP13_32090 [Klebsiella pneumoniae subsp. pneumoniae Kp13]